MTGPITSLVGSDRSFSVHSGPSGRFTPTRDRFAPAVRGNLALRLREVSEPNHPELAADVSSALDLLQATCAAVGPTAFAADLISLLELLKASSGEDVWRKAILPAARAHGIRQIVHECPFTSHSFRQPRGYPGDADLLDFVYRHPDAAAAVNAATPVGRAIMDYTVGVSACEAVRHRKRVLAEMIDEVSETRPKAQMLAVASGKLRESESSQGLKDDKIARFVATDQDEASLERVDLYSRTISSAIETRKVNVRSFISGKHLLGRFDLIYAAGLYDYLDERVASRLTLSLFSLLRPGGRLLVPNFRTGVKEEGYMEVYMDWYLLYRSKAEIEAFADEIPNEQIRSRRYFEDDFGTIGYLELERA